MQQLLTAAWKNIAGLAKVDAHLSVTDSDAAYVNTPVGPLSLPFAANHYSSVNPLEKSSHLTNSTLLTTYRFTYLPFTISYHYN